MPGEEAVAAARRLGAGAAGNGHRENRPGSECPLDKTSRQPAGQWAHPAAAPGVLRRCRGPCPDLFRRGHCALSAADTSAGSVCGDPAVHAWLAAHLARVAPSTRSGATTPPALIGTATPCRDGTIERTAEGYHVTGRFGFSSGCHHASSG